MKCAFEFFISNKALKVRKLSKSSVKKLLAQRFDFVWLKSFQNA